MLHHVAPHAAGDAVVVAAAALFRSVERAPWSVPSLRRCLAGRRALHECCITIIIAVAILQQTIFPYVGLRCLQSLSRLHRSQTVASYGNSINHAAKLRQLARAGLLRRGGAEVWPREDGHPSSARGPK